MQQHRMQVKVSSGFIIHPGHPPCWVQSEAPAAATGLPQHAGRAGGAGERLPSWIRAQGSLQGSDET